MEVLYKDENLEKVQKYLKMLESGKIDGYKNVPFILTDKDQKQHTILWSSFCLPDGTTIRMGADTTPELGEFFREEIVSDQT